MSDERPVEERYGDDRDISIGELFSILWKRKILIFGVTVVAALISVGYSIYLPNIYSSSALLSAKNSQGESSNALSQMAAQYGGLASIAGINLQSVGQNGSKLMAIETLKSRHFFREYLYDSVLVELMAIESWHPESNRLVVDPDLYDEEKGIWVRKYSFPRKQRPSVQEAFEKFSSMNSVSEDVQSGFVTVSAEHVSPVIAKEWVQKMVVSINEAMRNKAISESEQTISHLYEQREQTPLVSVDEVFAQLIEAQTKELMLAYASREYVFHVIEPPIVSELKVKPSRAIISVLGTMFGFGASVFLILIFSYSTSRN